MGVASTSGVGVGLGFVWRTGVSVGGVTVVVGGVVCAARGAMVAAGGGA